MYKLSLFLFAVSSVLTNSLYTLENGDYQFRAPIFNYTATCDSMVTQLFDLSNPLIEFQCYVKVRSVTSSGLLLTMDNCGVMNHTLFMPYRSGSYVYDLPIPINTSTYSPGGTSTYWPGNTSTYSPGAGTSTYSAVNTSTYSPGNTSTYAPGNTSTYSAGNTSTYSAGNTSTFSLGNTSTYMPYMVNGTSTYSPGGTSTYSAGNTSTYSPVNTSTYWPGNTSTYSDDNTSTYMPYSNSTSSYMMYDNNTSTYSAGNTSTYSAGNTSTYSPGNTSTMMPMAPVMFRSFALQLTVFANYQFGIKLKFGECEVEGLAVYLFYPTSLPFYANVDSSTCDVTTTNIHLGGLYTESSALFKNNLNCTSIDGTTGVFAPGTSNPSAPPAGSPGTASSSSSGSESAPTGAPGSPFVVNGTTYYYTPTQTSAPTGTVTPNQTDAASQVAVGAGLVGAMLLALFA